MKRIKIYEEYKAELYHEISYLEWFRWVDKISLCSLNDKDIYKELSLKDLKDIKSLIKYPYKVKDDKRSIWFYDDNNRYDSVLLSIHKLPDDYFLIKDVGSFYKNGSTKYYKVDSLEGIIEFFNNTQINESLDIKEEKLYHEISHGEWRNEVRISAYLNSFTNSERLILNQNIDYNISDDSSTHNAVVNFSYLKINYIPIPRIVISLHKLPDDYFLLKYIPKVGTSKYYKIDTIEGVIQFYNDNANPKIIKESKEEEPLYYKITYDEWEKLNSEIVVDEITEKERSIISSIIGIKPEMANQNRTLRFNKVIRNKPNGVYIGKPTKDTIIHQKVLIDKLPDEYYTMRIVNQKPGVATKFYKVDSIEGIKQCYKVNHL